MGQQLKVLVRSPGYVPVVTFFTQRFDPQIRKELVDGLLRLHESAHGRQILTLFQTDRIQEIPASDLDSARELFARHARLMQAFTSKHRTARGTAALAKDRKG